MNEERHQAAVDVYERWLAMTEVFNEQKLLFVLGRPAEQQIAHLATLEQPVVAFFDSFAAYQKIRNTE